MRYVNALPTMRSRVILKPIGADITTTFINANYVPSYDEANPKAYIISQVRPGCWCDPIFFLLALDLLSSLSWAVLSFYSETHSHRSLPFLLSTPCDPLCSSR